MLNVSAKSLEELSESPCLLSCADLMGKAEYSWSSDNHLSLVCVSCHTVVLVNSQQIRPGLDFTTWEVFRELKWGLPVLNMLTH